MKKLASILLIFSILIVGHQTLAIDSVKNVSEGNCSNTAITLNNNDIKELTNSHVDLMKVTTDDKAAKNTVSESEKSCKSSILWKIVKFPFSVTWYLVKAAIVLLLAVGGPCVIASFFCEGVSDKVVGVYKKIENGVVNGYKKIEDGVVGGYKKIEEGTVGAFNKVCDKFIEMFFKREGETLEETRQRLSNGNKTL